MLAKVPLTVLSSRPQGDGAYERLFSAGMEDSLANGTTVTIFRPVNCVCAPAGR